MECYGAYYRVWYAMLCRAMLCYAIVWYISYVMVCYNMLWYATVFSAMKLKLYCRIVSHRIELHISQTASTYSFKPLSPKIFSSYLFVFSVPWSWLRKILSPPSFPPRSTFLMEFVCRPLEPFPLFLLIVGFIFSWGIKCLSGLLEHLCMSSKVFLQMRGIMSTS